MEKQEGGGEDKEEKEKGRRSKRKVTKRTRRNGAGVKKEDLLQENRDSAGLLEPPVPKALAFFGAEWPVLLGLSRCFPAL